MPANTFDCMSPAQIPSNNWRSHHPMLHHITVLLTTAVFLIRSPACTVKSTYATIISLHRKLD